MTNIAIRVDNLSKLYHLGARQHRPDTLRDALVDGFLPRITRIARKNNSSNSRNSWQKSEDLWALKDISFEACPEPGRRIQRGEVVGIPSTEFTLSAVEVLRAGIGRNGAGKSTLPSTQLRARLKILSRITEPISGRAELLIP